MERLCVQKGDDYACLEYLWLSSGKVEEMSLVIPSHGFQVNLSIHLNGRKISGTCYNSLLEKVGYCFARSPVWTSMGYELSLSVDNCICLNLGCRIFTPLLDELIPATNDPGTAQVRTLQRFSISLHYYTDSQELHLDGLLQAFEYLLRSWAVNMEYKFPLIFSYYGRQFFRLNYNCICKTIDELFDPQVDTKNPKANADKYTTLIHCLLKLQRNVMTEFNILNVLKELDQSSSRRCAVKNAVDYSSVISIKTFVYQLTFLKQVDSTFCDQGL
ncbi:uncharacterized protein CANTADRAFT_23221 [Suhomyces tanzawaensis NRRL Y-17324]|uniref:Uncharacterized protein n=1 Tax=Suhomyces tanzawaensis NRRL Y-17324 TaxID=984487 RepID=A0A1E4SF25_9ASCO|nr:uncharacterized protein CANTADRAFT_23221 [Suhomyces tanzawaensis NRRL Y-17324]ODV78117.1 hypothetical protein CANTADRAFT_23221 [Suhomyces tanzawaensis NRRL Y-17324]